MTEPPVSIQAIHDDGPGNLPATRVVIHATEGDLGYPRTSAAGQALGTAHYFAGGDAGGSAHYVEDVAGEQHCVADSHIAWHAPPNQHSLGIEICGNVEYSREQWLAPDVWPAVVRAADRTRDLCTRYGIPAVRISTADLLAGAHGICGHVDVSDAWHQTSHTDPGAGFPWPEFMSAVAGASTSVSKDDPMDVTPFLLAAGGHAIALPVDPVGTSFVLPAGSRAWFRIAAYGQDITINRLAFYGGTFLNPVKSPTKIMRGSNTGWELPAGAWQVEIDYVSTDGFYGIVSALRP